MTVYLLVYDFVYDDKVMTNVSGVFATYDLAKETGEHLMSQYKENMHILPYAVIGDKDAFSNG